MLARNLQLYRIGTALDLTAGALEGSNVNVTKTLTDMIDASRAWETQVKMLSGAKEMDTSSAELMNVQD